MGNIAIIPARSGSKGLRDKNIKELCGKPLLAYTIDAAVESGKFDRVFVSTDSELYAQIAVTCGADVPFLRSEETATDTASSLDVIRETLERFSSLGQSFERFMLLQPTSPLRSSADITAAFELMDSTSADAIVSVCEAEHSPLWCNTLPPDGSMHDFLSGNNLPRQKLAKFYRLNGAVYLADSNRFLELGSFYSGDCRALIMDKRNSVDIDDLYDFEYARFLLEMRSKTPSE